MTDEEQKTEWMYSIFNKDKIMAQKEQWIKEAEEAGITLAEYLESINPLKQYLYEDYISRQAVLDAMSDTWKHICFVARHKHPTKGEESVYRDMCGTINRIPSVTPHYTDAEIQKMQEMEQAEIQKAYELGKASQPKTGHWIYTLEDWNKWECSECGFTKRTDVHVSIGYKFCPKCGTKMESEAKDAKE